MNRNIQKCKKCHHGVTRMMDQTVMHFSEIKIPGKGRPRHHSGRMCMEENCMCINPEI